MPTQEANTGEIDFKYKFYLIQSKLISTMKILVLNVGRLCRTTPVAKILIGALLRATSINYAIRFA